MINNKKELSRKYKEQLIELQQSINNEKFNEIDDKKKLINLLSKELTDLNQESSLIGSNMEELVNLRDILLNEIGINDKSNLF